jgi:glycerol-3-phosphate dehydrogenase
VINATGAWADELRAQIGQQPRLRRLRGSHLIFPAERFPLSRSISFLHHQDGRPVFAFPWEGVTLLGTTDVDHDESLKTDPAIGLEEIEYLLDGVQHTLPGLELSFYDIRATFSGVRPVVNTGKADPCKESREHVVWSESGLLTVTGGKLTTFRPMAHEALMKVRARLPGRPKFASGKRILRKQIQELPPTPELPPAARLRLIGRFGGNASELIATAQSGELSALEGTPTLWAELRWAAHAEGVVHLDDLLLRRTRLGLLLPRGGQSHMACIRAIAQPELGWDDRRWDIEHKRYSALREHCYHLGAKN